MDLLIKEKEQAAELIFTEQEWETIVESNRRRPNDLRDSILSWLKNTKNRFETEDREILQKTLQNLTPKQLALVKEVLGL